MFTEAKPLFSFVWLDEQVFYVATVSIRKIFYITARDKGFSENTQREILTAIDDLERLIEEGGYHLFGKVVVKQKQSLDRVQHLRNLSRGIKTSDAATPFTDAQPFS